MARCTESFLFPNVFEIRNSTKHCHMFSSKQDFKTGVFGISPQHVGEIPCMYLLYVFDYAFQLLSVSQCMQPLLDCVLLFCYLSLTILCFILCTTLNGLRFVSCLINQ